MKYVQVIAGCDMTRAATGDVVPAQETVYLAFGTDPARMEIRELDLTGDWAARLREHVRPFLDASHEIGEVGVPGAASGHHDGSSAITYYRGLRAWADETSYADPDGKPGYHKLAKGGYYHSVRLRRAYAEHLVSVVRGGAQPSSGPQAPLR